MYALEATLRQALDEGIEAFAARHQAIARACRAGVKALGLELWAAREEIAGAAVTGVKLPQGVEDESLRGLLRERYGIMISGGYGELAGSSSVWVTWVWPHILRISPPSSPCWNGRSWTSASA